MGSQPFLRVLAPIEPHEDYAELANLVTALLPRERTVLRAVFVQRPMVADLYLAPAFSGSGELERLELEAESAARVKIHAAIGSISTMSARVEVEILRGNPASEVLADAAQWKADLIVVRARRRDSSDHRLGRMATALLHNACCPVLTFHEVPSEYRPHRILLPTDFSAASRASTDWGLALAQVVGAEAHLFHVLAGRRNSHTVSEDELAPTVSAELRRWRDESVDHPIESEAHVVTAATPAQGILDFAETQGFDLIVLAGTGMSAARAIVLGSNSRKVLRASSVPVLVIPRSNRRSAEEFLAGVEGRPASRGYWNQILSAVERDGDGARV